MKLSKKIIASMTLGLFILSSTTSCNKKEVVKPKKDSDSNRSENTGVNDPNYCPTCGMG